MGDEIEAEHEYNFNNNNVVAALKERKNNAHTVPSQPSLNKGVWALKFTLMLHFEFVAQAVPHQCIAHHGAEHRAAAAAEKTTADASPSRLWIQSYPG